jgi:hypothetical protein
MAEILRSCIARTEHLFAFAACVSLWGWDIAFLRLVKSLLNKNGYDKLAIRASDKIGWRTRRDPLNDEQEIKAEVAHLCKQIVGEDREVCRSAANDLIKLGLAAIPSLCEELGVVDFNVRLSVANVLGEIGSPTAIPSLCEALRDADKYVRCSAAEALGKIADPCTFVPLCEALNDSYSGARFFAAEALGKVGHPEAVEPLSKALGDTDHMVRYSAANALGKIGDLAAVLLLCKTVDDPDWYVCNSAVSGFRRMGDEKGLPRAILVTDVFDERERFIILQALQKVRHKGRAERTDRRLLSLDSREDIRTFLVSFPDITQPAEPALRYSFGDIRDYCQGLLSDPEASLGARQVLNYLEGATLVRAVEENPDMNSVRLLRPLEGPGEASSRELLRASEGSGGPEDKPKRWTLFRRGSG